MNRIIILLFFTLLALSLSPAPSTQEGLSDRSWDEVIYGQPDEWYGSDEAVRVAENVLLYQRNIGGWPKNIPMHHILTKRQKRELRKLQPVGEGATIDNGATCQELMFLSKVYGKTRHEPYKDAFLKGVDYIIEAQYENGGWPQFYPLEKGDYSTQITYNDDAMVHAMIVMKAIGEKSERFSINADEATVLKAKNAFEKGVRIILKTQYRQKGVLTAWCAQHDENTFEPAKARSYELPSLSGGESAGIVLLLMNIDCPSPEIVHAVQSAVTWFEKVKISGLRVEYTITEEGEEDRVVMEDKDAPAIWARFYELEDNRPFFCDRDGVKKQTMAEIGQERRGGYAWYTNNPQNVLDQYENWQAKHLPDKDLQDAVSDVISYGKSWRIFEDAIS